MKRYTRQILFAVLVILVLSTAASIVASAVLLRLFPGLCLPSVRFFGLSFREILVSTLTIVICFVCAYFISREIINPLRDVSEGMKKISAGDYSVRIADDGSDDEISKFARNFNKMAKELQNSVLMQKDFAANISHQFKTPISVIQGYARLLEEDSASPEERRHYAGIIYRESDRMANLASNILRLSRLENSAIVVSPTTFDLSEQLRQAVVSLEPKWSKKNINMDIKLPDVTYYTGDEELLENVWVNIIDNAVKYTPDGGKIDVELCSDKKNLLVIIADNGAGMDEATAERACSPYFHGGSGEGTGLGLSIAKRIVELHGGKIGISSAPGEGTTVTVLLGATDIVATPVGE